MARNKGKWLAHVSAAAATIASAALGIILFAVVIGNDTWTLVAARVFTIGFFVAAAGFGLRALLNLVRVQR